MNAATTMQSRPGRNGQEHPARQTACAICDENPCRSPSFCRACRDADARKARSEKPHYVDASLWREPPHYVPALLDRSVSLERAWAELNRRALVDAPRATVEALLCELRTHGLATMSHPNCLRRLDHVSTAQLREVLGRLIKLRPKYPAITDDLLFKLGGLL
jgi:hypothetical protein